VTKAEQHEKAEQLFQAIMERFEIKITPPAARDRDVADLVRAMRGVPGKDIVAIEDMVCLRVAEVIVAGVKAMYHEAVGRMRDGSYLSAELWESGWPDDKQ
jgi:hypothetical protein